MANEFIITDIVDKQAFDQLTKLQTEFGNTLTAYKAMASEMGSSMKAPVSTFDELTRKVEAYDAIQQKMLQSEKSLADIQERMTKALGEVASKITEKTKAVKMEASYDEQLMKLEERLADLDSRQAQEVQKLKLQIAEKNKEVKRAAQNEIDLARSTDTSNKSYYEKQQILSSIGRLIKTMNTDTDEEKQAQKELIDIYNKLNHELKEVDESMGNFHRNVGNYKNSILEALGVSDGFVGKVIEISTQSGGASKMMHQLGTQAKAFGAEMWALVKNPVVATLAAIASAVALVAQGIKSSEENTKKWNVVLAPFNKLLSQAQSLLQKVVGWILDFALGLEKAAVKVLRFLGIFSGVADGIEQSIAEAEAANQAVEETTEDVVEDIKTVSVKSSEAIKTAAELASEAVDKLQDRYASMAVTQQALYNAQQNALAGRFASGEIGGAEYDTQSASLANSFAQAQQRMAIQGLEQQLAVENLTAEERQQIYNQLAQAKIKLDELMRNATVSALKSAEKASEDAAKEMVKAEQDAAAERERIRKEEEEKQKQHIQAITDVAQQSVEVFATLGSFLGQLWDNQMQRLDEQLERIEEESEAQIERIDALAAQGVITTEEAEGRKQAAERETERQREKIAEKQAEIQARQARMEKAVNIMNTISNTAVAIMKAWSQGGIFAAPMVALIGAQGALQLATIMAQQIPAYAEGTADARGGLSLVGDGGKREAIVTERGTFITPSTPTLVELPKHSVVLPDASALTDLAGLHSDFATIRTGNGSVVIRNDFDTERMEDILTENNKQLRNLSRVVRNGQRRAEYMALYARI